MRLSKLTLIYGLYIIISASFIQQVWRFLEGITGLDNLVAAVFLFFFALAALFLKDSIKHRFGLLRTIICMGLILLICRFALNLRIDVEKLHVFEYALLGWLATRDLRRQKGPVKSLILAIIFVTLISFIDEGFQKILPYRVGQVRDAVINIKSGFMGILLFLCG